tara:strand:+ start:304 stop:519 length:216 start_codon:yes stop_codon:yes gene_type:complete
MSIAPNLGFSGLILARLIVVAFIINGDPHPLTTFDSTRRVEAPFVQDTGFVRSPGPGAAELDNVPVHGFDE